MKQIKLSLGLAILILALIPHAIPSIKIQSATQQKDCSGGSPQIRNVTFSQDGKYVLASLDKGLVKLWEVSTGKTVQVFQHEPSVSSASLSSDNKYILTAQGKEAILWDTKTGSKIRTFSHDKNEFESLGMKAQFLPDNQYILTSIASEVVLWETETGKRIYTLPANLSHVSNEDVQLSLDGKYLLLRGKSEGDSWQLRDALTGNKLHDFEGKEAKFSPDNKYVLTADYVAVNDQGVNLWDAATKDKILNLAATSNVGWKLFSPDTNYIFLLLPKGNGDVGQVWDIGQSKKVLEINFESAFIAVDFSPDSTYLIVIQFTVGKDIFTKWDTHSWKQIVSHPTAIDNQAFDLLISPDGKYILTNGGNPSDENLHLDLWDAQGFKKIRSFC